MTLGKGIAIAAGLLAATVAAHAGGEIYGTVLTRDGDELTGPMRWDKNENFWDDFLDASKVDTTRHDEEGYSVRLLWWKVAEIDGDTHWSQSQFSIPFGHLSALEVTSDDTVELTLKTDVVLEVRSGGSDLAGMRSLVLETRDGVEEEVPWKHIRKVTFSAAPADTPPRDGRRLYGTVTTSGGTFTGFVGWDRDESLVEDVLDGEERHRDHEIPFSRIASIENRSRRSCLVTLDDGETLELRGTNDVNHDNRGIDVMVEGLGRVTAFWSTFEKVEFEAAPPSPSYAAFDGGYRLHGWVDTRDGRRLAGDITWDLDEEYSWEALDGEGRGVDYAILFEQIRSILPAGNDSARVRLRSGELIVLEDGNDVSSDNKGIVVHLEDGTSEELAWHEVRLATFLQP